MSRSLRKYLKQRVLDLHDGTALPSDVQSPSQRCACSLHNTFTESSTSLLCFYFNNQRSQSSTSSLLIFQITVTFSKQVVQSSGCIALQVSLALLKCNGFGISLFCKNTFPDFFLRSHLLSFRITSQSHSIITLQFIATPHSFCSSVIFKQQDFQHIRELQLHVMGMIFHTTHLIFLSTTPAHYSSAPHQQQLQAFLFFMPTSLTRKH